MEELKNLGTLIDETGLKVGNRVRSAAGLPAVSAVTNVYADANSNLATSVPLIASQPTITGELLNVTGTGAENIMTQTLVGGSDATTWTATGWIRVNITDSGGRLTNGYHYIQVGTLT